MAMNSNVYLYLRQASSTALPSKVQTANGFELLPVLY
jgi:hypothetical protein